MLYWKAPILLKQITSEGLLTVWECNAAILQNASSGLIWLRLGNS